MTAALLVVAAFYIANMRRLGRQYAAVLSERSRIAREFHDTLAQTLVLLAQQIHRAGRARRNEEGDAASVAIDNASQLVRQCLTETRRSLLDLRDEVLERSGLAAAIEALAAQVRRNHDIDPKIIVTGAQFKLDGGVEQNILRIAQEAVTNSVRHSGAKSLSITLLFGDDRVELSIADDGSGPPSTRDSGPLQLGLVGVLERADEIGGRIEITGSRGHGTTVHLFVPKPNATRRAGLATRIAGWSTR